MSITLYQVATGTGIREECTDYVTANNEAATQMAIKAAFKEYGEGLGTYLTHVLGQPDKFGKIDVTIIYLDFADEETTLWQLRPVAGFL